MPFTIFLQEHQAEIGGKNQEKDKTQPEAELLLLKICFLHPRLSLKIIGHILKVCKKASVSILMRLY